MEYEMYVAGIGGQGIQLVAKILALAAMSENRHVMLNGFYGFEMRGGISLSTVAIGDGPLKALPVAAWVDAAVVLHHLFWESRVARLRPGAWIVVDSEIAPHLPNMPTQTVVEIAATRIAREIGNPMVMGMVLMSAFNTMTGIVRTRSLVDAMKNVVPAYRRQHVDANESAILKGAEAGSSHSHALTLDELSRSLESSA